MFKVVKDGVEIHCETADEALDLAARLSGTLPSPKHHVATGGAGRWTVARFQHLMNALQDKQREFLREVVKNPDGVTDAQLRQTLALKSNKAFGPVLTGLSRKAKKVGVSLDDIFESEKRTLNSGEKFLEFKPNPSFSKVAHEAGGVK